MRGIIRRHRYEDQTRRNDFPLRLPSLAAWFDALDPVSILSSTGATITDGAAVALWGDKSGNSGVNCLVLNGAAGNYASMPDSAALSLAGDVEIVIRCALPDYTPAGNMCLVGKWNSTGSQKAYVLNLRTTGALELAVSADGSTTKSVVSSVPPLTDYGRYWLMARYNSSTGAMTFGYAADQATVPASWTSLTGGSVASGSVFDSNATLNVGYDNSTLLVGNVFYAHVTGTFGGAAVGAFDFTNAPKLATSFTASTGQTVTINTSGATGARISGERDLYQGTVANRPIWLKYSGEQYGYNGGITGAYFSTPDSAAVSATTALDFKIRATHASSGVIASKATTSGNQRSWRFGFNSATRFSYSASANGSAYFQDSSIAMSSTLTAGAIYWYRFTYESDIGGSKSRFRFYTAPDTGNNTPPSSWTLEATDAAQPNNTLYDSTSTFDIGGHTSGATPADSRTYYAQMSTTLDGAATAVFNPVLYTGGTTFTASTGEVWTVNGGAHIVTRTGVYFDGSNDNLKSAAISLSQPESVYPVFQQVSWTSNDYIFDGNSTSTMLLAQTSGGASPSLSVYAGTVLGAVTSLPLQTGGIVPCVFNSTLSSVGVNRNSPTVGNAGSGTPAGFTLGANGNLGGQFSNIVASEVAIYAAAQPLATQNRLALYAGRKWGFSV